MNMLMLIAELIWSIFCMFAYMCCAVFIVAIVSLIVGLFTMPIVIVLTSLFLSERKPKKKRR